MQEPTVDFEIRDVIDVDLEGGTLIECFPSTSSLALIIANIILEAEGRPDKWNYDQVAIGDSSQLPSVCVVYYNKPKFPIRIYANADAKIALLASEIPQYPPITRDIGRKIFNWTKEKGINRIISIEEYLPELSQELSEEKISTYKVSGKNFEDAHKKLLSTRKAGRISSPIDKAQAMQEEINKVSFL